MIRRPPRSTLFPTRRSSDLGRAETLPLALTGIRDPCAHDRRADPGPAALERSEEHTSELQSRLHLVCRLLLEKKKKRREQESTSQTASRSHISHALVSFDTQ